MFVCEKQRETESVRVQGGKSIIVGQIYGTWNLKKSTVLGNKLNYLSVSLSCTHHHFCSHCAKVNIV